MSQTARHPSRSVSRSTRGVTRDVDTSVDITQEDKDRGILRVAPENKPWMPPRTLHDRWSGLTSDSYRIRLFDSSRLHGLDVSAKAYRTEQDYYIDVFFKHRWYSANYKHSSNALLQAWNAFILNVERVGPQAWLAKLAANRSRFEKRTLTGARFKLHRLTGEAVLSCLSCHNSMLAPKEAYLHSEPWWRARISSEMR